MSLFPLATQLVEELGSKCSLRKNFMKPEVIFYHLWRWKNKVSYKLMDRLTGFLTLVSLSVSLRIISASNFWTFFGSTNILSLSGETLRNKPLVHPINLIVQSINNPTPIIRFTLPSFFHLVRHGNTSNFNTQVSVGNSRILWAVASG